MHSYKAKQSLSNTHYKLPTTLFIPQLSLRNFNILFQKAISLFFQKVNC